MEFVTHSNSNSDSAPGIHQNPPNNSTTMKKNKSKKAKNNNKKNKKNKSQKGSSTLTSTFLIDEVNVDTVLNSPETVNIWFQAYQTAFQLENQFIDQVNNKNQKNDDDNNNNNNEDDDVSIGADGKKNKRLSVQGGQEKHQNQNQNQGQSSAALGLDGAAMLPLVFSSPPTQFRRVCFFVREEVSVHPSTVFVAEVEQQIEAVTETEMETETDTNKATTTKGNKNDINQGEEISKINARKSTNDNSSIANTQQHKLKEDNASSMVVAYATVDEDILQPNGVCHIRMILVQPSNQRRGIGKQLLHYIEKRFRSRHLGLKYANCHDYKEFYASAGFRVIGADERYTYMAIRRC